MADSSSVRTCGGSRPSVSSQTIAPLEIVETVEFVHHHGATFEKSKASVQQSVEEDFGDHDQDRGVGVLAAVAGHEANVVGMESPSGGQRLHLAELLLRQGDQRRGVVGRGASVQGLEQRGLGDERLARAGGAETITPCSAENHANRASSW